MPLMFASTALFPRQFLPERLKAISAATYGTPPDATAFIYLAAALVLVERLLTAD